MLRPKLENLNDIHKIKYLFTERWREKLRYDWGNAEIWYESVLDFLAVRKYDIISPDIRNTEEKLMRRGLAKEYLASLLEVVSTTDLDDEARLLALSLATAEERLEALEKVITRLKLYDVKIPKYLKLVR